MTSLHVIFGLPPPPNQKSWLRLCRQLRKILTVIQIKKKTLVICALLQKQQKSLSATQADRALGIKQF